MKRFKKDTANLLPAEANKVEFERIGDHAGICWQAGLVVHYEGVLLPDGTRSDIMRMADPEYLRYRRLDASGKFVYGKVDHVNANQRKKSGADLVFRDDKDQSIPYSEYEKFVIGTLRKCDTVSKSVCSYKFSERLFGALADNIWFTPGLKFVLNARSAGKVVAKLRGKNECYMDFFLSSFKGIVQDSIRGWLEGNGFELLGHRNWDRKIENVCELLKMYESRSAEANPPEWFSRWIDMDMGNDNLIKRMHLCCFRNRVSLEEWEEFLILLPDCEGIMDDNGKTGKPCSCGSKSKRQVNQV